MLAGEAGIGKSRMLGAILRKAAAKGFRLAKGDLTPHDREVPLASLLDLARAMRGIADFGTLGTELLDLPAPRGGDALGYRRLLVRDIADRIVGASDRPTLLAFEDLQWADELSLEVVGELARVVRDRPLLLLAAYRPEEFPADSLHREWRARLLSQRLAEEATLERLTRAETALVTTLILGTGLPAPSEVVAAVHERTNGIPLHIEELLAALEDEARTDGHAIRSAVVPNTIEDAVLARAARLSEDARAVARAGAVIGRCFTPEALAGVMDCQPADLDAAIDELVGASFLFPFSHLDRGFYDFRHQLLRDALYASVPTVELRRLHARAGEFGGQLAGTTASHASVHFERAGLHAQAYRAALTGAREAARLSSHREAFELYRRALDNRPADLDPLDNAVMFEAFAEEAAAIEDNEATHWAITTAREHYRAAARPIDAARMLASLASLYRRIGRPVQERIELVGVGLAELDDLDPGIGVDAARADLLMALAVAQFDARQLDDARMCFIAALDLVDDRGRDPYRLEAAGWLAAADVVEGRVADGLDGLDRSAGEARRKGYESIGVTAYRNAALTAIQAMDYARARTWLEEGLRYADSIEQSHCRDVMRATRAHLAWANGHWDDAVAIAEQSLADGGGGARAAVLAHWALAYVAIGRKQQERAASSLAQADRIARTAAMVDFLLPGLWGLAETALASGDAIGAIEHCEEALAVATRSGERALGVPFVVTGTRSYLGAGRPAAAVGWLERCAALLSNTELARPALDHAAGLLRLAAGSTVAARDALEAAVGGWDALGRAWEATWGRLDLGRCLARSARIAAATEVLTEARAHAAAMGADLIVGQADELLRIARGRGADDEAWRPLTFREFEVARLIADGLTNGEIAAELDIAPRTVSAHVEHILAKLGVTRRTEVAVWVARIGLAGTAGASEAALTHR